MEKYCQNCNTPNAPEAMFCRRCATPLSGQQQPYQPQQQPPPNQGQYQNQQWGQQGGGFAPPANNFAQPAAGGGSSSSRATTAAILAVCGILCCGLFTGIPAALLGWLEVTAIKEGRAPATGMMMAQVGLWGGIIGTILWIIGYFFMMLMSMANRY